MWLTFNGVPMDVAFALDDDTRTAWAIVFSRFNGAKFNMDTFTFEEQR